MAGKVKRAWIFQRKAEGRSGWYLGWWEGPRRRTKKFATKKDAQLAKIDKDRWLNSVLPPSPDSIINAADAYLRTDLADKSTGYRSRMAQVLDSFREITGVELLSDANANAIIEWQRARSKQGAKPHTIYSEEAHLAAFLRWCFRTGRLASDPFSRVRRTRRPQLLKEVPSEEDWLRLLETCSAYEEAELDDANGWYVLILLAQVTGIRQADLLKLRWDQLEWPSSSRKVGLLRLTQAKTSKQSIHGLPTPICEVLMTRHCATESPAVFLWPRWQRKQWDRLRELAEFPFTFHSLRAASGARAAQIAVMHAGAAALHHSSPTVFENHYASLVQTAVLLAEQLPLPDLPPAPRFGSSVRAKKGRRTTQIE